MVSRKNKVVFIIVLSLILSGGIPAGVTGTEKPELELPEIVISASAPALIRGAKEPVPSAEIASTSPVVSRSAERSPLGFPEVIEILDAPTLTKDVPGRSGCLAPFGPRSPESRLRAASTAAAKEDWNKVVKLLMPIVEKSPDDVNAPKALYFIGRSKQKLGDLSGATNAFEQLRRKYPDSPLAEYAGYTLGWIYLQTMNTDRAIEVMQDFRTRYPNSPLTPYARYLIAATQYVRKNYEEALSNLQGIVAGYPLFPYMHRVQFWMAETMFFTGKVESAEQNYSMYIQNFPDDIRVPAALYGRAFCYIRMNRYGDALADFNRLITSSSDSRLTIDAEFQAGKLCVMMNRMKEAAAHFNAIIDSPSLPEHHRVEAEAWIAFSNRIYAEAASLFEKAASLAAKDPALARELRFMEARSYLLGKQPEKSAPIFEEIAREATPELKAQALASAGVSRFKLGEVETAEALLQTALEHPEHLKPVSVYKLYYGEVEYRLHHYATALQTFEELAADDSLPEEVAREALRSLAWSYYSLERWSEAAQAFQRYTQRYPDARFYAEALLREAESRFNAGEYDAAVARFDQVIREFPLHPESFEARLLKARTYKVQDDFIQARKTLDTAFKYAANAEQRQKVRMLQGDLARDMEEYEIAAEYYQQALREASDGPAAPEAMLKYADCLYSIGNYERAKMAYRELIDAFPSSREAVTAQYSIGLTYFQQNNLKKYLQECYETADSHPGSEQGALALMGAAEILVDQKRYDEAENLFRRLLRDFSSVIDDQDVRFRLAKVLSASGKTEASDRVLMETLEKYPHGRFAADALMTLARHALARKDFEEASRRFQQVIDAFPGFPMLDEALLKNARALRHLGQQEAAERQLKRIADTLPQSPYFFQANLDLAELLVQSKRCDAAKKYIEKAGGASRRDISAAALALKAECLVMEGKDSDALAVDMKISYLYPDQKKVVFKALMHAGKLLEKSGNLRETETVYKKALAAAETDSQRKRARQALKQLTESEKSGGTE